MSQVYAVILAGGRGDRMGAEKPKQFLALHGMPLLIYTLNTFTSCPAFDEILLVTHPKWITYTESLIQKFLPGQHITVIAGGENRHESLMKGVSYLDDAGLLDTDPVLVTHDAVRPLVSEDIILENIACARRYGACATMIPAVDTIAISEGGDLIDAIPDRRSMYQMQTPQSFRYSLLRDSIEKLSEEQKEGLTDAAKILLLAGARVHVVQGSRQNLKITYSEDLNTAEILVANRQDFGYNG